MYAAISGLTPGDTILTFNKVEVHTWEDLTAAIKDAMSNGGKDIPVTYERNGIQLETTIKPVLRPDDKIIGVSPVMTTYHFSFIDASASAVSYAAQVGQFALRLIIPTQTMEVLNQSSSVVGISVMASEAAAESSADFRRWRQLRIHTTIASRTAKQLQLLLCCMYQRQRPSAGAAGVAGSPRMISASTAGSFCVR